jgi:KipI family sensor histidine kinase inhibitor
LTSPPPPAPTPLRAHHLGDSAVAIVFGTERSAELLHRIHSAARALESATIPHVEDVVPAYLALTVFYDSLRTSYSEISAILLAACDRAVDFAKTSPPRTHRIPVRYNGGDLDFIASSTGLSVDEVVARHAGKRYTVDLLGFVPGFGYLGELDPALHLPRRAQPRPRVAAGSVGIAGAQTAVYPLDTPGGWHIIGSTQTVMFDPAREPPALLAPGDTVYFERVE